MTEQNSVIMTSEGRVADIEVMVAPDTYEVVGIITGTNCDHGFIDVSAKSPGGLEEAELLVRSLRQMADHIEALVKEAL